MADLCTNPGFETDATGWFATGVGESIVRTTGEAHSGSASGQVTTNGSGLQEGAYFEASYALEVGQLLTTRAWAKGSGVVRLWASTVDGLYKDIFKSGDVTLTGTWQQITVSGNATVDAVSVRVELRTTDNQAAQAVTFYIDDAELIVPDAGITYKRFTGPAQLSSSASTLYTCPTGMKARILHIHASNPSASPVDLTLSIGADAAGTRVYDGFPLDPDQIEHNYDPFDLAAGDIIQGFASSPSTVVLTITGYEVPA